LDRQTYCCFSW